MKHQKSILGLTILLSFIFTTPALAYIGPGIGIALAGYTFGPIIAIVSTIAMIAYFPLRYLYKKHKRKKLEATKESNK